MTETTGGAAGRSGSRRAGGLWLLAEILAALAVVAGSYVAAGAAGLIALEAGWTDRAVGPELFPFLVHPTALVVIAAAERRRLRSWLPPRIADVGLGAAIGLGLVLLGAVYQAAVRALGFPVPDVAAELRARVPSYVLLPWGAALVPLAEEAWFRGRLVDGLDPRLGTAWTAGITSALFAAVHGIPVLAPAYVAFSLVLLAARRKTGSLVAPIVAHAVNNLVGLLAWGP